MPSLAIQNQELYENIALVIGVNRDPELWDDEIFADANRVIRAGRRKFFMVHNWSFLEDNIQFITEAPTKYVGSCVNGVITLTDQYDEDDDLIGSVTLPDDPVGYYKIVPQTDPGVYDLTDFDVAEFTLADTSVDFDEQDILIYKYAYDLPSNFSAFMDPIVVENNDCSQLTEYATLPDFQTSGILNRSRIVTGPPEIFSIAQAVDAESGDFSCFLTVYPFPAEGAQYVLKTRIKIMPGDGLDELGDVFNPMFSEILQECILAQGEIMYKGTAGIHTELFGQLLPAAILRDKQLRGTRRLLPRHSNYSANPNAEIRRAEITWADGALLD